MCFTHRILYIINFNLVPLCLIECIGGENMNNNCNCRSDCLTFGIAAAIVVGIVTAILRFTAIITVTPVFLWVTLGIAVVYLALLLVTTLATRDETDLPCRKCWTLTSLLIGLLGTILLSVVLLAIPFAATSALGAVLTGLLLAFFTLFIVSSACLVKRC